MPTNSKQVKMHLDYLTRLDNRLNPYPYSQRFVLPNHYSKHRERLIKMYWIFKKQEVTAQ